MKNGDRRENENLKTKGMKMTKLNNLFWQFPIVIWLFLPCISPSHTPNLYFPTPLFFSPFLFSDCNVAVGTRGSSRLGGQGNKILFLLPLLLLFIWNPFLFVPLLVPVTAIVSINQVVICFLLSEWIVSRSWKEEKSKWKISGWEPQIYLFGIALVRWDFATAASHSIHGKHIFGGCCRLRPSIIPPQQRGWEWHLDQVISLLPVRQWLPFSANAFPAFVGTFSFAVCK